MDEKKSSRDEEMTLVRLCSEVDSSFLFFGNGGKEPLHHDKDIDRHIESLRFAELAQFLNTLICGNVSLPHKKAMY